MVLHYDMQEPCRATAPRRTVTFSAAHVDVRRPLQRFILQEFDKDRNALLSPAEAQRLAVKHLPELKRVGYYTTISRNGKPVTYEFTLSLSVSLR